MINVSMHEMNFHENVDKSFLLLETKRKTYENTNTVVASLDLPIAGNAFLVKEKVLPFKKKIIDLLPELQLEVLSLKDEGALLLKGQTYLVYVGKIDLPSHLRGHLSPKSSIGRIDLMVRGVVDGCGLYDTIPSGQKSDLWLEITPQSFNVRIRKGLAPTLMLFTSDAKQILSNGDEEEKWTHRLWRSQNVFYMTRTVRYFPCHFTEVLSCSHCPFPRTRRSWRDTKRNTRTK